MQYSVFFFFFLKIIKGSKSLLFLLINIELNTLNKYVDTPYTTIFNFLIYFSTTIEINFPWKERR